MREFDPHVRGLVTEALEQVSAVVFKCWLTYDYEGSIRYKDLRF